MGGPKRVRRRSLSAEDKALWDHVTRKVRRVDTDKMGSLLPDEDEDGSTATQAKPPRKSKPKRGPVLPSDPPAPRPQPPVQLQHGSPAGMDRRTAQRLKRGKLDVEGKIDLHGHTQKAAHRELENFLFARFMAGSRTVLVITGKGDTLGGRPGVLRESVPRWFNEMPMRQWVAGFSYAAPKDGGDGALYVRLKRRKPVGG
ncbi:MAG: Smr/MutS family protein [Rhodospirillales bacterium]